MKILIVSGFLGAGKTTFIRTMSQKTGRDFVVYENEYSGSSVDTKLLENESLSVWESTENCVCCTGKSDFASSIMAISGTLDPEFLIVEPTGVAKLRSIIQNISQICYDRIKILSPVTIADCVNYRQQKKSAGDVWTDQMSGAGTIVCSKIERSEPSEVDALKKEINDINPSAQVVSVPFEELTEDFFRSLLARPLNPEDVADNQEVVEKNQDKEMETLSLQGISFPTPGHLIKLLNLTVGGAFGKVSRAKGYMPCGTPDEWLRFDLVAREWAITGMEKPENTVSEPSVITFIGEELERNILRNVLLYDGNSLQINKLNKPNTINKKYVCIKS